jgi:23S rRNA (adenine2030-N6)-methyltransferase
MNYRHAFHAGNFADVLKHAALALILSHLCRKDTPFRVIDTHAGIGLYDLGGDEASRTGEWRGGIGRLDEAEIPAAVAERLADYLRVVGDVRRAHGATIYPGSPEISRRLTRAQDRVVLIEKHPDDAALLAANMKRDSRVKVVELDGWTALKAYVPPPEKRGLVLIDPPFEEAGEFARMVRGVTAAWSKWRTGIYAMWYPIKDRRDTDEFAAKLAAGPFEKMLRIELLLTGGADTTRLNGCGLIVVNPPWMLAEDCAVLLPWLVKELGQQSGAHGRCDWLAGPD